MFAIIRSHYFDAILRGSFVAAALALSLVASPTSHAQVAKANDDIIEFAFAPATLQVTAGTSVTWTNHDAIIHSVTSGTPDAADDTFDTGFFDQDQSVTVTFNDVGDFTYFCKRHNFMRGTVSVTPA